VEREIPVCMRCAHRLEEQEAPEARLVRLGNRRVPWFVAGPAYEHYALGYYGAAVETGRLQADRLTGLYGATVIGGHTDWSAWSDPGAWEGGGMIGGHDYTGYGGPGFGGDFGGDGGGGGGDAG
jgi:hypothetical protein